MSRRQSKEYVRFCRISGAIIIIRSADLTLLLPGSLFAGCPIRQLLTVSTLLLMSCTPQLPNIAGKWRELGKTSTLEFWPDGAFQAVDDMGMTVDGTYTLEAGGNVRFDIRHENSPNEIVQGRLIVQGDELVFTSSEDKNVEIYKRSPQ